MPTEVILPRVDMDMASGRISRWFVEENGRVEKGQPLFEIETDKAAMEVEAPASGVLSGIVGPKGIELPVGSTVAWILAGDEAPPGASAADDQGGRLRASPLARRLARERGIDLSAVPGSGPRGRIQRSDIVAYEFSDSANAGAQPSRPDARRALAPSDPLHSARLRRGEGPPLVLLHGFGSDLNGWRPFLVGVNFDCPVLALDLPGHGESILGDPVTFEGLATAVETALLEHDVGNIGLVGHSLGGAIAAWIAARTRVTVRSLLLLAPAGLGPEINGGFLRGYVGARSEASLSPWMSELVAHAAALNRSFVRATAVKRVDSRIREAQERLVSALFPDGTQAFSVRALMEEIVAPVKLVFGADDRIIPAAHARGLPGTIAVHVFPGVGHMPHLEATPDVQRLAAELLRSAPP